MEPQGIDEVLAKQGVDGAIRHLYQLIQEGKKDEPAPEPTPLLTDATPPDTTKKG